MPRLQNDHKGRTARTQILLSLPQGSQQGTPFPTGCCAAAGAWPVFHLSQSENSGVSGGKVWMQKSGGSTPAWRKELSQSKFLKCVADRHHDTLAQRINAL